MHQTKWRLKVRNTNCVNGINVYWQVGTSYTFNHLRFSNWNILQKLFETSEKKKQSSVSDFVNSSFSSLSIVEARKNKHHRKNGGIGL